MLRRLILAAILLLPCHSDAFWHGTSGNLQQGGGPNLLLADVFSPPYGAGNSARTLMRPAASSSDYYRLNGLIYTQPYDLNAMGAWGQAIATAKGNRYVWLLSPDHPIGYSPDAMGVWVAYSNDPAILPDPSTMVPIIPADGASPAACCVMVPKLVYNPDDVTHRAYIYTEGIDQTGGGALSGILWKRDDFDGLFTFVGIAFANTIGITSFQTPSRTGVNTWVSWGPNGFAQLRKWTSTDGATFTLTGSNYNNINGNSVWPNLNLIGPQIVSGGNTFSFSREDFCDTTPSGGAGGGCPTQADRLGMYVSQTPVDATTGALVTGGSPPITRISTVYSGIYPGPTYISSVGGYCEDGICLQYAVHGFFSVVNFPTGLGEEYLDIYGVVVDSTAAANAAPMGVAATAAAGTATISWYEPPGLPTHSYNVYRSTAAGTKGSLVGSTSGTSVTDTPTASSSCTLYFYRVYKVDGSSAEQGFRTVSIFVSTSAVFVNQHITRACNNGADFATIDRTWLNSVDTCLEGSGANDCGTAHPGCNCLAQLRIWTDAAFGVVWNSGTGVVSRIFDLGTTRLPRQGDLTFTNTSTHTTTYGATAFNSAVPGWVNADSQAFGIYGNYNRGLTFQGRTAIITNQTTATLLSAYTNTSGSTVTLLSSFDTGGYTLAGTPTNASFAVGAYFNAWGGYTTGTKALTGATAHIIAGDFDGTTVTAYAEGVAGTGAGPTPSTGSPFLGGSNIGFLVSGSDSASYSYTANSIPGSYGFFSSQAQFTGNTIAEFSPRLTPTQIASVTALIRARVGP